MSTTTDRAFRMRLIALLLFVFVVWTVAGFAPTREWNAEMRVFAPQLFFKVPFFLIWGLALVRFTGRESFYEDSYARLIAASTAIMLFQAAWGFLYVFHMHETSGGFFAKTPCGASSCSADTSSQATYNPNGFFTAPDLVYTDYRPTICMYDADACTWGPSPQVQGPVQYIKGYNALPGNPGYPDFTSPCDTTTQSTCLATNRTQDYPHFGLGIPNGFLNGLGTLVPIITSATQCPGTKEQGGRIVGRAPCSYCYPYFKKHYPAYVAQLAPFDYCPSSAFAVDGATPRQDNHLWCGRTLGLFSFCPQPEEVRTPHAMQRIVVYWYIDTFSPALVLLFLAVDTPAVRKSKRF